MRQVLARPLRQAKRQVADDLRSDPYLAYILLLTAVLAVFWIWHRLPNFATRDERWRVVDPVEALAAVSEGVSYESLRDGVTYWRSYGATFYLSAFALVPVVVLVVGLGQFGPFAEMGRHESVNLWRHWLRTPGWIWSASILLVRLVNVGLTVGSVYLVYRIGTAMRDRATGRLAALLMTLTWGVLVLTHEAGEDVPMLFFFLLAVYLAFQYVQTGLNRTFYWGCVVGGLAAALKLSGGVSAVLLGAAFLVRANRETGSWRERLLRPRFLLTGMGLGIAFILAGYPSVLIGDPAELGGRIARGVSGKGSAHGWRVEPSWWWILRGYLHGLGLPLFLASVGAVAASLRHVDVRTPESDGLFLALTGTGTFMMVYGPWAYVRMHHLLPTFPLLALVVAAMATRLRASRPAVARPLIALLLVTSGAYAVGGDLAYASQPKDQSTAWLSERADANTTVETHVFDPQEAGVPHDVDVSHPNDREMMIDGSTQNPGVQTWTLALSERCPDYVVLTYHRSLLYLAPDSWGKRTDVLDNVALREFYRDLLAEDTYAYEVAEEFGRRPRFLDGKDRRPAWRQLLHAGVRPRSMQYGDPQDFGVNQYTVVLEQSGECDPAANSPYRLGSKDGVDD